MPARKTSKRKTKNNLLRKLLIAFWAILLGSVGGFALLIWLIANDYFGKLPTFEVLENPETNLASEVYTADNVLLGKYYSENRSNVDFDQLSPYLVKALIATEDIRFYKHSGIDPKGTFAIAYYLIQGKRRGSSTITQQLAKNLFPREKLSTIGLIIRKFKEWIIAVRLERCYTKQEIITMYFNTVEFSDNAFGIKSAARTYFNKPPDSLNVLESAVLVGMLKAPYAYNPRIHPEASRARRNIVLSQMAKYGFIPEEDLDSLMAQPIQLRFKKESHISGLAPYFREILRLELHKWMRDSVNFKPDGTPYDIYSDGLKIYTTIDSRIQKHAEEAVREHLSNFQDLFFEHWKGRDPWSYGSPDVRRIAQSVLTAQIKNSQRYQNLKARGIPEDSIMKIMNTPDSMTVFSWQGEVRKYMSPIDSIKYHRMFLQTGLLAVDPHSGEIKAWVGGINYKYFKYDHVNENTKRQVGSTFKPIVYTIAIEDKGYSPCFKVPNEKIRFEKGDKRWNLLEDWEPENADGEYGGMITLKDGLAHSVNTVTAYLMHEIGSPQPVINLARNMGITSDLPPYPSLCLGVADISVYEMTGAYTTYANKGIYTKPYFIRRIEDKNGNIIATFNNEKREALNEQTAYVMVEMLRNVVNNGTGHALSFRYKLPYDIAGKTGTTQNHSDGWFMGFTPDLVAGVWVGCDDRFIRFRTIDYGQGAKMALPIWAYFVKKVYEDPELGYDPKAKFQPPTTPLTIELDCSVYESGENELKTSSYGSEYD